MDSMINLDDPELYQKLDPADMLGRIAELPQQCGEAWRRAMDFDLPSDYGEIDKVVISGMGGSAIGGDLLASLVAAEATVPILVHRDYGLPSFVDAKTMIIASSYSGMTEETISSLDQALTTPAKKLIITSGGRLRAMAEGKGIPLFTIDYLAQPRAALAHNFIPLIAILQKLGLIGDKSPDVAEAVKVLDELKLSIDHNRPLDSNPAKQLATELLGHIVIIYGAGILSGVARRWKTQINENSKAWSFHEVFPELNHNAIVGYEFPAETKVFVVLLRSPKSDPRTLLRYQVTCELLAERKISYETVDAEGKSPLSQMLSLILFGDYVSYYLALLYQADPTPVKAIAYLKQRLAGA
jgi:glucose/mannose-6-phosphate isomerase